MRTQKNLVVAAMILVLSLSVPLTAQAQSVWTGNLSDLWGTSGNWTGGVPNSASASADISATTNNPVWVNGNYTVGTLALDNSTNSLLIVDGDSLTYAPTTTYTLSNYGTITIGDASATSTTKLNFSANYFQSNAGTITLGGSSFDLLSATGMTGTTFLQNTGTINGGGSVSAPISNAGTFRATNGTLIVTGKVTQSVGNTISSSAGTPWSWMLLAPSTVAP